MLIKKIKMIKFILVVYNHILFLIYKIFCLQFVQIKTLTN